jgi:hypothetical protein
VLLGYCWTPKFKWKRKHLQEGWDIREKRIFPLLFISTLESSRAPSPPIAADSQICAAKRTSQFGRGRRREKGCRSETKAFGTEIKQRKRIAFCYLPLNVSNN